MNAGQQSLLVQFGVWRYVQEGSTRVSRFLPQGAPRIMYCYPSTPVEAVMPQINSFLTAEYRVNIAVFQKRIERVMRLVMAGMMRAQTARRAENAPSAKRVKVEGEVKRESVEEDVKEEDVKEEDVKEEDVKEEDVKEEDVKEDVKEEDVKEEDVKEEDVKEEDVKEEDVKEDVKEEDVKEEDVKEEEDMNEEDTEEEVMVRKEDTEDDTEDYTEESMKEATIKKEDAKNTPHSFDEAINAILNERDWRKPNGTR